MTTLGIDISNYTSELTPAALTAWKADGVGLVIVQSVDPPANFPPTKTRLQVRQCSDAGLVVDIYVWLWFELDVSDIRRKLALLEGLPPIRRLWLDVEDTAAKYFDQVVCEQKVQAALDACDTFQTTSGARTGIYTAHWFWVPSAYMNNSEVFADRDLWTANYDSVADAGVGFVPYGGWSHCAVKQHQGTTTFHGVSGVDLNVLSAAEATKLNPEVVDDVLIPDDVVTKFSLRDNHDVEGLIANYEGVLSTVRDQANAQDADCQTRLQKVRDAVGT